MFICAQNSQIEDVDTVLPLSSPVSQKHDWTPEYGYRHLKHGFEWDDDHLHTNMFDHPYNGSIFFNAGRSTGFNFWQSELFAIGGSAMWEMFMECEYPSTNDINTFAPRCHDIHLQERILPTNLP